MKAKFSFALLALYLLMFIPAKATHIVGAELTYSCISNGNYRFKLLLYRDCLNGTAPFDNPIDLFVFHHNSGTLIGTYTVNLNSVLPVEPENWDACVGTPSNICVEVGTYQRDIQLTPTPGGYDVAWARCCRNNNITNLQNPGCQGVSFLAHVPGNDEATGCNSMPVFNQFPSIFLCAGMPFYFNHAATDADGDSLAYEISNPYTGYNTSLLGASNNNPAQNCTQPALPPTVDAGNPMGPPPYVNVTFNGGFNYLNPFGTGSISINPNTGFLVATPINPGIYVLAISVKEYRNGVFLSENKRDFQFHVIPCMQQSSPPVLTHDLSGLSTSGDTIFAQAGIPFCYDFTVEDTIVPSHLVVTPLSIVFGGNGGFPPPYATITTNGNTPPVQGTICWEPHCNYVGQDVPVIISARDTNDCANYNVVFDTVWIHVLPSPIAPPVVTHDLSGLNTNGDTILINVETPFCYDFMIVDTLGGGQLTYANVLWDTIGVPANQVQTVTTTVSGDTIFGTVCWNGYCNYGETYFFVTTGTNTELCPPGNTNTDTVWIRILEPENPSPVITTDISGNILNNDTIIINVHETGCFDFTVVDTAFTGGAWDSLSFGFTIEEYPAGGFSSPSPTYYATVNGDTLTGEICWIPRCPNVNRTYRVIVQGIQFNQCFITNYDYDTVYIHVIEPIKPPPMITHDLGALSTNDTIIIEDSESFCYDFTLSDTLMPTYLTYSAFAELMSGQIYTGAQLQVTFTQQLDSFVTGNICWEVPCEFANGLFRIVMEGRDTFDCHPGNIVYDTVYVRHVENNPDKVTMCRITVLPGDASVAVEWLPSTDIDADHYEIHRRREDETAFVSVGVTSNFATTSWTDVSGINADDYVYCYRVFAVDRCGNLSVLYDEACTIKLRGENAGYAADLNWTPYIGFPAGVLNYELQHRNGTIDTSPWSTTAVVDGSTLSTSHDDIGYAVTCYKVDATEANPGCGLSSSSNEICLVFPSTLFMPNAFTPNGDGVNDVFIVPGEFLGAFHLLIMDRWGQIIFETTDQTLPWKGDYKGKPVPEGVYVYRVRGLGYDQKLHVVNGTISVVR